MPRKNAFELQYLQYAITTMTHLIPHPHLSDNFQKINVDSFFSVSVFDFESYPSPIFVDTDNDDINYMCKKVDMFPNTSQKELIAVWEKATTIVYNEAIRFIRKFIKIRDLAIYRTNIDTLNYLSKKKNNLMKFEKLREYENNQVKLLLLNKTPENLAKIKEHNIKISTYNKEIKNNCSALRTVNSLIVKISKRVEIYKKKIYKYTDYYKLRDIYIYDFCHKISKEYNIYRHILDATVKQACANFKSCITNYERHNCDKFNMRKRKFNRNTRVFEIESDLIKPPKLCFKLGIMKCFYKINHQISNYQITKKATVSVHHCLETDKYTLLVAEKAIKNPPILVITFISIDLGIRVFITALTNNQIIKVGENLPAFIKKQLKLIDTINKDTTLTQKEKSEQVKYINCNISNIIDDMHWKVIKNLVSNYSTILIGDLSVKSIVRKGGNLSKMTKRIAMKLKFNAFRSRLKYQCARYGTKLHIVDERYTTTVCSLCANKKDDVAGKEIYRCDKCPNVMDRDVNSCCNIAIKHIKKIEI